jgi:hypothetical protein
MDIFTFLEDDAAHIAERLTETGKNYSTWTRDRIFEEAKNLFQAIKDHFAKVAIVENNLKNPEGLKNDLIQFNKLRDSITSDVEQIVEIHVDEPGFEQSFEQIAKKFTKFAQYSKDTFFPIIKKNLSAEDLKHIQQQFDQKVLS